MVAPNHLTIFSSPCPPFAVYTPAAAPVLPLQDTMAEITTLLQLEADEIVRLLTQTTTLFGLLHGPIDLRDLMRALSEANGWTPVKSRVLKSKAYRVRQAAQHLQVNSADNDTYATRINAPDVSSTLASLTAPPM